MTSKKMTRSLIFETTPPDEPIEIFGAPVETLDVTSDRPIANLVVRPSDVHPSGELLRVTYGISTSLTVTDTKTPRRWR